MKNVKEWSGYLKEHEVQYISNIIQLSEKIEEGGTLFQENIYRVQ